MGIIVDFFNELWKNSLQAFFFTKRLYKVHINTSESGNTQIDGEIFLEGHTLFFILATMGKCKNVHFS